MDNVVEKAPDQFLQSMQPVFGYCIDSLIQKKIYAVDVDTFWHKYEDVIDCWSKPYFAIADQVAELRFNAEQMDAYRRQRRQLRGRIIGGGFGISGAIKGTATAGAMNAVIGAGHMLFNGIGKITTNISTSLNLQKIYNDPNTLSSLKDGVYSSAFNCHFALVDCYNEFLHENIPVLNHEDIQLAQNYLSNASRINNSSERCKLMLSALEINPYDSQIYLALLNHYGDYKRELETIATYFGVDIGQIKTQYIKSTINSASWPKNDFKAQKEMLEKLLKKTQIYDQTAEPFYNMLADIDKAARTVSGVTFDTMEEADESRKESESLKQILEKIRWDDRFSLQEAATLIAEYHSPLANFLHAHITEQQTKIEDRLCKVEIGWGEPPIVFASLSESQNGLIFIEQINHKLKQSNLQDINVLQKLYDWTANGDYPANVKSAFCKLIARWIEAAKMNGNRHGDYKRGDPFDNDVAHKATSNCRMARQRHGCLKRVAAAIVVVLSAIWIFGNVIEKFNEDDYMTRAEFAQLLNEITPLTTNFSLDFAGGEDVSQLHWARASINACIENQIMLCEIQKNEDLAYFRPDDPVTKSEMAYGLSKVCTAVDQSGTPIPLYNTQVPNLVYSDMDEVDEVYSRAVNCMQFYHLMGTDEDGVYNPGKKVAWDYAKTVLERCRENGYLPSYESVDDLLGGAYAPNSYHSISIK